jgi:hypothetical protein
MNIGGLFKAVINPATLLQVAMGPAGWASIAVRAIGAAVGQQVIQQLGQKLGLPQGMISLAQNAFATATGTQAGGLSPRNVISDLAQQFALSPRVQGQLQRQADSLESVVMQMGLDQVKQATERAETDRKQKGGASTAGASEVLGELGISGGWLVAFAAAMGEVMDKKANDIMKVAGAINEEGSTKLDAKDVNGLTNRNSKLQVLSSTMQGLSQELNTLSQAVSTALKSSGEAQQTLARKQ